MMRTTLVTFAASALVPLSVVAGPVVCDADKYTMCPVEDIGAEGSELDHVDLLGYSGMAFRVHALPRMMLCRSTVVARYGYKPGKVKGPTDAASAIRLAAQLVGTQTFDEYVSGRAAYELWISLLEADDDSAFMKAQLDAHRGDGGLSRLNGDCLRALIHARTAAAPFLKRRAEEFAGKRREAVLKSAGIYAEVVNALRSAGGKSWTPEDRKRQAGALRKAMELEAAAADLLRQALKVE